jgi:hypothetical protein
MKTFIVHLGASAYADVEVEAESEEEANKIALTKLQGIRWEVGEAEVFDTELSDAP